MNSSKPEATTNTAPVLIQLGKQRRKRIKQLLRGEGKLFDEVNTSIEELKSNGTLSPTAQTVIVVVKEKPRKVPRGLFG